MTPGIEKENEISRKLIRLLLNMVGGLNGEKTVSVQLNPPWVKKTLQGLLKEAKQVRPDLKIIGLDFFLVPWVYEHEEIFNMFGISTEEDTGYVTIGGILLSTRNNGNKLMYKLK